MSGFHEPLRSRFYNQEYWIFNLAMITRESFLEVGGFDAENFEATAMAHADLRV